MHVFSALLDHGKNQTYMLGVKNNNDQKILPMLGPWYCIFITAFIIDLCNMIPALAIYSGVTLKASQYYIIACYILHAILCQYIAYFGFTNICCNIGFLSYEVYIWTLLMHCQVRMILLPLASIILRWFNS